jgi:hypothetical protein
MTERAVCLPSKDTPSDPTGHTTNYSLVNALLSISDYGRHALKKHEAEVVVEWHRAQQQMRPTHFRSSLQRLGFDSQAAENLEARQRLAEVSRFLLGRFPRAYAYVGKDPDVLTSFAYDLAFLIGSEALQIEPSCDWVATQYARGSRPVRQIEFPVHHGIELVLATHQYLQFILIRSSRVDRIIEEAKYPLSHAALSYNLSDLFTDVLATVDGTQT